MIETYVTYKLWDACNVGEDLADHRNAAKLESERVVDSVAILEGSVKPSKY